MKVGDLVYCEVDITSGEMSTGDIALAFVTDVASDLVFVSYVGLKNTTDCWSKDSLEVASEGG